MAFKSLKEYNEERYSGKFILTDDGDSADVIFLYQSYDDAMKVDCHYIKSSEYNGYAQHIDHACPACAKGLRVQTKLFIPLYVLGADEIQFWDRSIKFQTVIRKSVFNRYANPSEYVFRITRHGVANDTNTTYEITAIAKNTVMSYNEILAKFNAKMPDYYENICKGYSSEELSRILATSSNDSGISDTYEMPKYQITPRVSASAPAPVMDATAITDEADDSMIESLSEDEEVDF